MTTQLTKYFFHFTKGECMYYTILTWGDLKEKITWLDLTWTMMWLDLTWLATQLLLTWLDLWLEQGWLVTTLAFPVVHITKQVCLWSPWWQSNCCYGYHWSCWTASSSCLSLCALSAATSSWHSASIALARQQSSCNLETALWCSDKTRSHRCRANSVVFNASLCKNNKTLFPDHL